VLSTILNAFRVADIRKKLAFTALILGLYRMGSFIPVPGVNAEALKQIEDNYAGSAGVLGLLNTFTGGGLSRIAIFALGIMPYITGLDHPAAADGRLAVAREAAEGGRGRHREDHPVHAVPHRRARRRPVGRLRLPLPLAGHRPRRPVIENFSAGT
jgi:preprotein translocase subunit SecY